MNKLLKNAKEKGKMQGGEQFKMRNIILSQQILLTNHVKIENGLITIRQDTY